MIDFMRAEKILKRHRMRGRNGIFIKRRKLIAGKKRLRNDNRQWRWCGKFCQQVNGQNKYKQRHDMNKQRYHPPQESVGNSTGIRAGISPRCRSTDQRLFPRNFKPRTAVKKYKTPARKSAAKLWCTRHGSKSLRVASLASIPARAAKSQKTPRSSQTYTPC